MGWKTAFLAQARSDYGIFQRLDNSSTANCHKLHYLQMVTEKLAKAVLSGDTDPQPPDFTHAVFVTMLQSLKGRPDVRRQLRYQDARVFRNFINSLLDLATKIEQLAPSIAGIDRPNPEYPWLDRSRSRIVIPAVYGFTDFDWRDAKMQKMMALVRALLNLGP